MMNIMEILAREWRIGYAVSSAICITSYIIYSVLLIRSCRRVGYDVGASGMIPLWNLILLFKKRKYSKKVKNKKQYTVPKDGEEFEL